VGVGKEVKIKVGDLVMYRANPYEQYYDWYYDEEYKPDYLGVGVVLEVVYEYAVIYHNDSPQMDSICVFKVLWNKAKIIRWEFSEDLTKVQGSKDG
tara:strand:- start:214 stop:501 length:288 start_codon:yes stop_codon:yes gene_type:complete